MAAARTLVVNAIAANRKPTNLNFQAIELFTSCQLLRRDIVNI
jgi:hypothetical protein